jgi:hypothetical protein
MSMDYEEADAPPKDQPQLPDSEVLLRFEALQHAETAKLAANIGPHILAAIRRKDRVYPEGMSPRDLFLSWQRDNALRLMAGEQPLSPEEYAVQEAARDADQPHFQTWRDHDDEAIRAIDRGEVASTVVKQVATFLVKGETRDFHLDELALLSPFEERAAIGPNDKP